MSKSNVDFFDCKKPWSVIKDDLLKCYLGPYFCKIFSTGKPTVYVDCFAEQGEFLEGIDGPRPFGPLGTANKPALRKFISPGHMKTTMRGEYDFTNKMTTPYTKQLRKLTITQLNIISTNFKLIRGEIGT